MLKPGDQIKLADIVVLVVFECVAIPICIAAGEAFVSEHYGRSLFGWAIGIPLAVAGFTGHWWVAALSPLKREWIEHQALRWWPAAVLLAFLYVTGPDMYRRAMQPVAVTGAIGEMPIGTAPVTQTPPAPPAAKTGPQSTQSSLGLSTQDIATKIDIWQSVEGQMNDFARAVNQGHALLADWSNAIRSDRKTVLSNIDVFRQSLETAQSRLDNLRATYPKYDDVARILVLDRDSAVREVVTLAFVGGISP